MGFLSPYRSKLFIPIRMVQCTVFPSYWHILVRHSLNLHCPDKGGLTVPFSCSVSNANALAPYIIEIFGEISAISGADPEVE